MYVNLTTYVFFGGSFARLRIVFTDSRPAWRPRTSSMYMLEYFSSTEIRFL